jgi:spermidine/putrescine ABC transporter ATP-binding subunit
VTAKPVMIAVEGVSRRYSAVTAVDNVSLDILSGEFFILLGPSGCGKTTLLRMMAGFDVPDEGRILIDGQDMAGIPPNKRPVNMLFQSYAIFPHMNVADNVGYGLKIAGVARGERDSRIVDALKLVAMDSYAARMPDQLSGGQRQRVALARSLVMQPKVLLLDEPLSALDAKLRGQMQFELSALQDRVGITFVMVTHDQDEALSIACRIAVMDHGRIAQIADPQTLYEQPANRFVADFVGHANLFDGVVAASGTAVKCAGVGAFPLANGEALVAGRAATLAIRPERIAMTPDAGGKAKADARGVIRGVSFLGDVSYFEVLLESGRVIRVARANQGSKADAPFTWDTPVALSWMPDSLVVLVD